MHALTWQALDDFWSLQRLRHTTGQPVPMLIVTLCQQQQLKLPVPGTYRFQALVPPHLSPRLAALWQIDPTAAEIRSRLLVRGNSCVSTHLAAWAGCPLWQPLPRGKGCQIIRAAHSGHRGCMAACTLGRLMPHHPCTEVRRRLSAAGLTSTSQGGQHIWMEGLHI